MSNLLPLSRSGSPIGVWECTYDNATVYYFLSASQKRSASLSNAAFNSIKQPEEASTLTSFQPVFQQSRSELAAPNDVVAQHRGNILHHKMFVNVTFSQNRKLIQTFEKNPTYFICDHDNSAVCSYHPRKITFKNELGQKRRQKGNWACICHNCRTRSTSQWRKGPDGLNTLCNRCGLRFAAGKAPFTDPS